MASPDSVAIGFLTCLGSYIYIQTGSGNVTSFLTGWFLLQSFGFCGEDMDVLEIQVIITIMQIFQSSVLFGLHHGRLKTKLSLSIGFTSAMFAIPGVIALLHSHEQLGLLLVVGIVLLTAFVAQVCLEKDPSLSRPYTFETTTDLCTILLSYVLGGFFGGMFSVSGPIIATTSSCLNYLSKDVAAYNAVGDFFYTVTKFIAFVVSGDMLESLSEQIFAAFLGTSLGCIMAFYMLDCLSGKFTKILLQSFTLTLALAVIGVGAEVPSLPEYGPIAILGMLVLYFLNGYFTKSPEEDEQEQELIVKPKLEVL